MHKETVVERNLKVNQLENNIENLQSEWEQEKAAKDKVSEAHKSTQALLAQVCH